MPQSKEKEMNMGLRGFDRSLPMSLMRARESVMKEFVPHLREHDLTPQQWRVIRALEEQESPDMSELSERCFLLKPSLSRIVQTLEGKDLIKLSSDCLLYTSPSPRDLSTSRMPSSA